MDIGSFFTYAVFAKTYANKQRELEKQQYRIR
jgi:hypothetical protein